MSEELRTRLTGGKSASLILPEDMTAKDYDLLGRWFDLLAEAYGIEAAAEIIQTTTVTETKQVEVTETTQWVGHLELHAEEIVKLFNNGTSEDELSVKFNGSVEGVKSLIRRHQPNTEFAVKDRRLKYAYLEQHTQEIIELHKQGVSRKEIAAKFGATVYKIDNLIMKTHPRYNLLGQLREATENGDYAKLEELNRLVEQDFSGESEDVAPYKSSPPPPVSNSGIGFRTDFIKMLASGTVIELREDDHGKYFTLNGIRQDAFRKFSQAIEEYSHQVELIESEKRDVLYQIVLRGNSNGKGWN